MAAIEFISQQHKSNRKVFSVLGDVEPVTLQFIKAWLINSSRFWHFLQATNYMFKVTTMRIKTFQKSNSLYKEFRENGLWHESNFLILPPPLWDLKDEVGLHSRGEFTAWFDI